MKNIRIRKMKFLFDFLADFTEKLLRFFQCFRTRTIHRDQYDSISLLSNRHFTSVVRFDVCNTRRKGQTEEEEQQQQHSLTHHLHPVGGSTVRAAGEAGTTGIIV